MKRRTGIVGIVGFIVVIVITGLIAAPFLFNVNRFRPEIEAQLTNALGRQVKIGALHMSLLTGTVRADYLSIADNPSFSSTPFVQAKSLKIGVEVIPLIFSRAIHVTGATLQQPQIQLLQSKSGSWNFSNLGPANSVAQAPAKRGNASIAELSVQKLNISNGRLPLDDHLSRHRPSEQPSRRISSASLTALAASWFAGISRADRLRPSQPFSVEAVILPSDFPD